MMEIDDFKDWKHMMDNQLAQVIQKTIEEFRDSTGYSPNRITVDLADVTTNEERNHHYVVIGVNTEVDI